MAIGTNNDGDLSGKYTPNQRGHDWAALVAKLRAHATAADNPKKYPHITVVGANDIEAGFAGTAQQAEDWEAAYLRVTDAGNLIFNGSADNCPSRGGQLNRTCTTGWTQAEYYYLAHGINPSRMRVLPQIYTTALAQQWVNIELTGGNALNYAGVLTEHAACPAADPPNCPTASMRPATAWSVLHRARSPLAVHLAIPAATDLQVDDGP